MALLTIAFCGDVMTGRGIDQVLAHPVSPQLYEPFVHDAREYVHLAERAHGPIPKPVDDRYLWGDAFTEWARVQPDARIANLETSVTQSNDYWRGKEVHYRMHPANIGCLKAAQFDCWALSNNHVLDWGYAGLAETLETLRQAGLRTAGAGRNRREAEAPVVLEIAGKGRVVLFAFGSENSGIPRSWAAGDDRPGVSLLPNLAEDAFRHIQRRVASVKRAGDVVVLSIHWGSNWGYHVPDEDRYLAHRLIEQAGVDVIHGHSSHHPRAIEVYRGRLILYGCGDFLNDYEGIAGYESYRGDLGLVYFASVEPRTGNLVHLQMTPTRVRRMRIERAPDGDARWLRDVLDRESRKYNVEIALAEEGALILIPPCAETDPAN